jgi:hypothetical protein
MSTIREYETTLKKPQEQSVFGDDKSRYRINEDETARVRSTEGEVTPRLRHTEKDVKDVKEQHYQPQGVQNPSRESRPVHHEEHHGGISSLIDNDKVKMIQEKGTEAKKAFQNVFHRGWDTLTSKGKPWNWTKLLILSLGLLASMFFLSLMALSTARMMMPYPKSASCQVNVTFRNDNFMKTGMICEAVKSAFVHQMKEWESKDNCKDGGMKCLYKVEHVGEDVIHGTHKTSDWFGFTDNMKFKFYDTAKGDCFVEAYSESTVPFAYIDLGVNYCNIHNLVHAVAGNEPTRYTEVTRDEVCTQYSSSNCEKY